MFLQFFKRTRQFHQLYRDPKVVSCIFRAIDDLSKAIILRLMKQQTEIVDQMLKFMIHDQKEAQARLKSSIYELQQLMIIIRKERNIRLEKKFRNSLEEYIISPKQLKYFIIPEHIKQEQPLPLHHLLYTPPTQNIKQVLIQAKLIFEVRSNTAISNEGFGFILDDVSSQICTLIKGYMRLNQRDNLDLLSKLLEISLFDLDKAYVVDPKRWSQTLLDDLQKFGFIIKLKGQHGQDLIRVNRVFRHFSFEQPEVDLTLKCDIIVQTNFKVYAHIKDTRNYDILKKILSEFLLIEHGQTDFQELIVGSLNQEKLKEAYARQITSQQILKFFRKHTDLKRLEQAKKKGNVLDKNDAVYNQKKEKLKFLKIYSKQEHDIIPNNVIQQLKLWEQIKQWTHTQQNSSEQSEYD